MSTQENRELKELQAEYRRMYEKLENHYVRCTCAPCIEMKLVYDRMVSLIEDTVYGKEEN